MTYSTLRTICDMKRRSLFENSCLVDPSELRKDALQIAVLIRQRAQQGLVPLLGLASLHLALPESRTHAVADARPALA